MPFERAFLLFGRENIALRNWNWFSGLLFRLKTLLFRILFFLHFLALFGPALCVYWLGSLHIRRAQIFLHFPCVCQLVSCKIIYGYDDNDNFSCSFLYADASERARVCVCVCTGTGTLFSALLSNHLSYSFVLVCSFVFHLARWCSVCVCCYHTYISILSLFYFRVVLYVLRLILPTIKSHISQKPARHTHTAEKGHRISFYLARWHVMNGCRPMTTQMKMMFDACTQIFDNDALCCAS